MSTVPATVAIQSFSNPRIAFVDQSDSYSICRKALLIWLTVRTTAWTVVASLQPNPPLDVLEWLAWGRNWQLGYHKHPPLAAWIADLGYTLTGGRFFGIYLAGYLFLAWGMWSVWRLSSRLLPARLSLASVLCLDGLCYLGSSAAEFNNQVLLLAFWVLAVERFYAAVERDSILNWSTVGVMLGLALLCKYSAMFLILPLLAWWIYHFRARRWMGPAIAAGCAFLVFLPHLVWLVQNDFPTLKYAAQRTQGQPGANPPYLTAGMFIVGQIWRVLPVVLILLPLVCFRRRSCSDEDSLGRSLILTAFLGPILLHLFAGFALGLQLRDIWGYPLLTLSGLGLLLLFETRGDESSWAKCRFLWLVVAGSFLGLTLAANWGGGLLRGKPLRIHYPGAELAREICDRYREKYGINPGIIAGDWWLAANIACHSPHRPLVYGSREPASFALDLNHDKGDPRRYALPDEGLSWGVTDGVFKRDGGIIVWDSRVYGEKFPPWLANRFPSAQQQPGLNLPCSGGSGQSLKVGWVVLAPQSTIDSPNLSRSNP